MNILYSHEMDTRNTTLHQGEVKGYGRITRILPLPEEDHDFYKATETQQKGQFQIPGCQMKDMNIRQFAIFKDVTNHWSSGQIYPLANIRTKRFC